MGSVYVVGAADTQSLALAASLTSPAHTFSVTSAREIIFPHCAAAFVGVDTGDHLHPVPLLFVQQAYQL
jgi:hypothetical protein